LHEAFFTEEQRRRCRNVSMVSLEDAGRRHDDVALGQHIGRRSVVEGRVIEPRHARPSPGASA